MKIYFKTKKMAKILNNERLLRKEYGNLSDSILKRLKFITYIPNLSQIPISAPFRRHKLNTKKSDYKYAICIKEPYRIVFQPNGDPPLLEDGGIDLSQVTEIMIISIKDYH
jgi:toxin HigB-1